MENIIEIILLVVVSIVLDIVWIGFIANKQYKKHLHHMLIIRKDGSMGVRKSPAVLLYFALAILVSMNIMPVYDAFFPLVGAYSAFVFGLLIYAFYELTNYAILKDWPRKIIILDTVWGGILVALSSLLVSFIL